jgi:hypothetical protein
MDWYGRRKIPNGEAISWLLGLRLQLLCDYPSRFRNKVLFASLLVHEEVLRAIVLLRHLHSLSDSKSAPDASFRWGSKLL